MNRRRALRKRLHDAERQLHLARLELKQTRDSYQNMVEEVNDYAILMIAIDGTILNWNKGVEKIKGYTAGEVIGKDFRIFYTAKDRAAKVPEQLLAAAVADGRVQHEGWRLRKDGTLFWSNVTITAMHNRAGEVTGFLKITHDLTERRLAEENRRIYTEKLEIKNSELEQFTYIASHDLQEPLRSISSLAQMIVEQYAGKIDEHADAYLRFITQSVNRMSQLIKGLLDYSRLGKAEQDPHVDCNEIVATVLEDLQSSMRESQAIITVAHLPILSAYPMELKLLFQNLLSNAMKFRHKDRQLYIDVTACLTDEGWLFEIRDNGIGIEPRFGDKIFEIFQRLHSKAAYEGTGIGLAHCKKIVAMHNGRIWVDSIPGKGSRFKFIISA
ncbi:sensor histidine kinase [Chitinophaga rhizophila]|uniref:histidine kinase n=1 Tax=Chitinophaga rhizophila TaxID=2866212 RepID=A0ABS7GLD7_9BACT|nr:ATP-binding protein [Chitinophaga rhizophila]MBW8687467.1 PAS domain S-box protein [Chitinophaga rhizophila]